MRSASTLRATAFIAASVLALHQLRYLITGHGSSGAAAEHAYLPLLTLAVGGLLALAGALFVRAVVEARRSGQADQPAPTLAICWAASSVALLAVHAGQEGVEAALTTGAVPGLGALVGPWAPLLAVALGALVAVGLRGASRVVAAAARARAPRRSTSRRRPALRRASGRRVTPLARNLASRAPPLAC